MVSEQRTGLKHTEEAKEKISKTLEGNQYRTGIPHTEEMRKQLSESVKRAYAEGRHKKSGGSPKGRKYGPMSQEEKDKRSAGAKLHQLNNPNFIRERAEKIALSKFIKTVAWG
jgi:sugar-specific transcriptional regulator TrmB